MLANIILDPDFLFINAEDWNDDDKRDLFIEHISEHVSFLEEFNFGNIIISEDIFEKLWTDPSLPPWRHDTIYRNQLIPILSVKLSRIASVIEDIKHSSCALDPVMVVKYEDAVYKLFIDFISHIIKIGSENYILLGVNNAHLEGQVLALVCDEEKAETDIATVYDINNWYKSKHLYKCISNSLSEKKWAPTVHELFPNKRLFDNLKPSIEEMREISKKNPETRNSNSILRGGVIAGLNGYVKNEYLSKINSSNEQIRDIYEAGAGKDKMYLSIDIKSHAVEVCNYQGIHKGEFNFNGIQTKGASDAHCIKIEKG